MLLFKGTHIIIRDIMMADFDSLTHWLHPSHDWHKLDGPYYPPAPEEKIPRYYWQLGQAYRHR